MISLTTIVDNILTESKEVTYIIYKATYKGKHYIGQTRMDYNLRLERHKIRSKSGESNKFHKALKHHGFHNFKWRKMHETNSKEEADQKEFDLIKKYNSIKNGYNSTCGRKKLNEKEK